MSRHRNVIVYCADAELGGQLAQLLRVRLSHPKAAVALVASMAETSSRLDSVPRTEYRCVVILRTLRGRDSCDDAWVRRYLAATRWTDRLVVIDDGLDHVDEWKEHVCLKKYDANAIVAAVHETRIQPYKKGRKKALKPIPAREKMTYHEMNHFGPAYSLDRRGA